jgi:hypothetical protein
VKPKQFGILVAVCAVAIGALGAKAFLKPRAAGAAVAKAPAAAPAPAAPSAAPGPSGAVQVATPGNVRTVQLTLETRPARDPFRPFFLVATPAAAPGPTGMAPASAPAVPAPKGLVLKAIVAGELAVINDETVGVGDEVVDPDGKTFVVEEIQERRVVLREGGRRAELGYAATSKKRPQTAAGSLSPARK